MATTKAHAFLQEQARNARPAKPKAPPKRRRAPVDPALMADAAASTPPGEPVRVPDARTHAGRRGGASLEPVPAGTTKSRKSTRKSADHVKQSTNLQLKASRAAAAPSARTARGAAKTQKARVQTKATKATRAGRSTRAGKRG